MSQRQFLPRWNEEKVYKILEYSEAQTEEELFAEYEAIWENPSHTVMQIPNELVPVVQELLSEYHIVFS